MSNAMHTGNRRHGAKGFTLIELLVVIAIIAILAAILFPVFNSARNRAKAAACTSNLKQIGLAFQMYLDNFDDAFPSSSFGAHIFMLEPYVRQIRMTRTDADPLSPAMKKPAVTVWLCPAAPLDMYYNVQNYWWVEPPRGQDPPWYKYGIIAPEVKVFHSYVVNNDVTGDGYVRRSSRLRQSSHTVLAAETCYWYRPGSAGLGSASTAVHPTDYEGDIFEDEEVTGFDGKTTGCWCRCVTQSSKSHVHPRHGDAANFLWADGRVSIENKVPDLDKWIVR